MSNTLTEVDEFTANVTVPSGGDPRNAASVFSPFQALANRTTNLDGRVTPVEPLQDCAVYSISGTTTGKFTLTEVFNSGGFSVASNEITVPSAGKYALQCSGTLQANSATNPLKFGYVMKMTGGTTTVGEALNTRFSATLADEIGVAGVGFADVVTPGTDTLSVYVNTSQLTPSGAVSYLIIRRVA
jgi:hypothetical protein